MLFNCVKWGFKEKTIALAQTYFAVQTRKMEIQEKEYYKLTEDEKRLYQRNLTKYKVGDTKEIELKGFENGEIAENGV